ncbi:hypothetical protein TNCV_5109021 [Trichonephila clavipes]|nr:hypothetical protein TNCV_5109021 [Trichonephila clavipes]
MGGHSESSDLIPDKSKTSYGSSMEHMQVSVATERDPCPNQDSTTSITVSSQQCWIDGISVRCSLQISRRPESLSIVNLYSRL